MSRRKLRRIAGYQPQQTGETTAVRLSTLMGRAAFRLGFEDRRDGRPPQEFANARDAWTYERGRLFACVYPHSTFKDGRTVRHHALEAYKRARAANEII